MLVRTVSYTVHCECLSLSFTYLSPYIVLLLSPLLSTDIRLLSFFFFFFFNDTATTEIYTLSLHDALPISGRPQDARGALLYPVRRLPEHLSGLPEDRRARLRVGLQRPHRRFDNAPTCQPRARPRATLCLVAVRRLPRSLPGEDQHPRLVAPLAQQSAGRDPSAAETKGLARHRADLHASVGLGDETALGLQSRRSPGAPGATVRRARGLDQKCCAVPAVALDGGSRP